MQDSELYTEILGIVPPWRISKVELNKESKEVEVFIETPRGIQLPCAKCGELGGVHDRTERRWRHLDSCEYQTVLVAKVPRVKCPTHGTLQVPVPWGERNSRFSGPFEALAIDWLRAAPVSVVARELRLSWDQVDGIMARAVTRGLARRKDLTPTRLCIDETSFQKRHEYVSVVCDGATSDVIFVADGRKKESLEPFFDLLDTGDLLNLEWVSMDMWPAFISVVEGNLHRAEEKICFDKFHVAMHLSKGVDQVRRGEQRLLLQEGDRSLVRTKYKCEGSEN